MSQTWDGPLAALVERAIDDGLAENAVFRRARRHGWTPPVEFLEREALAKLLRKAMEAARRNGLIVEHDGDLVLQDGEGGRL